jgi:hypothetical protein
MLGRSVSDPMQISQTLDRGFEPNPVFDELCEVMMPSELVNMPQNERVAAQYTTGKSPKKNLIFLVAFVDLSRSEIRT